MSERYNGVTFKAGGWEGMGGGKGVGREGVGGGCKIGGGRGGCMAQCLYADPMMAGWYDIM